MLPACFLAEAWQVSTFLKRESGSPYDTEGADVCFWRIGFHWMTSMQLQTKDYTKWENTGHYVGVGGGGGGKGKFRMKSVK